MKRLNRSLHGDDKQWYRLPETRELAAQYLLLYEVSLPSGLNMNSQIDINKSSSRLTTTLDTIPTSAMQKTTSQAEQWLTENVPDVMRAKATGTSIMFAYLTDRNNRAMLSGTAFAFLLIAGILILALRSVKLGLVSLMSNFFTVLFTFRLWAILVGEMGIIASVISATSLGLIIDDTVHILSKYNRAKQELQLSTHNAVRYTFSHVGNAL
ncbi:MAG: MMPL family transporter [Alphaproteobacteria bacterium]|nr:MMPL family transporter [Alphaproteobacteria bacterium]